ncbi:MAG: hypothetical protein DRJ18_00285 [Candidatus Methanomethylicota archaeon]|nr:MAG: hypothetical protein DRJ18_00285 [Candidatus Verstraetearchaeota archaeon]
MIKINSVEIEEPPYWKELSEETKKRVISAARDYARKVCTYLGLPEEHCIRMFLYKVYPETRRTFEMF